MNLCFKFLRLSILYSLCAIVFSAVIQGASFEPIGTMNERRLSFLFKDVPPVNLLSIDCVKLDQDIRPTRWPDRIPLALFINQETVSPNSKLQAGFINYQSFFRKSLAYLEHPRLTNPIDISGHASGLIAVADEASNAVFIFQFNPKENKIAFKTLISVDKPHRVNISDSGDVFIMSRQGELSCYDPFGQKKRTRASKKISSYLAKHGSNIQDFVLNKYNDIYVVTGQELFRFTVNGRMQKSKPIKHIDGIDCTAFGDVVTLQENRLEKYTRQLDYLDSFELAGFQENKAKLLSIYRPFGYVGVAAADHGIYLGMGVDIHHIHLAEVNDPYYHVTFTTTFPADVELMLLNENGFFKKNIAKPSHYYSGNHTYLWDRSEDIKPEELSKNIRLKVKATARYSLSNTVSKQSVDFTLN